MRVTKKCAYCGIEFITNKSTKRFCCRSHFKKDYDRRQVLKKREERLHPHYAKKTCEFCRRESEIPFDIVKHPEKFNNWQCPYCWADMNTIFQHRNSPNSHEQVFCAVLEMRIGNSGTTLTQVFQVTTTNPGQ